MPHRIDREGRGGFTLVEIMIALAILGIVVAIAASNFEGLMEKYRVEGETKQMFADLMDARARAMQRNRTHFVKIAADGLGYKTYDDTSDGTNPAPDGNGFWNPTDTLVAGATTSHPINAGNLPGGTLDFAFNRNGIASVTGFILVSSDARPDYDCITVNPTRIKMGQYNATDDACVEK